MKIVFNDSSDHNFEGKHRYFDKFSRSFAFLEKEYPVTVSIVSLKETDFEFSFIYYNQLIQGKLTYLNYMVSVVKSLCSGSKRSSRGRLPYGKKSKLALAKAVLNFGSEMHLPVKTTRRRCAYCTTKKAELRSDIECFTCKLAFCLKEEKIVLLISIMFLYGHFAFR